nr:hypothetical protein [Blautia sp. AF34-10]
MKISKTDCLRTPKADGFYMPGEFEPHEGTLMICRGVPVPGITGQKRQERHLQKLQKQLPLMSKFIFSSGHRIKHRHRNCFPPTGFI